VPLGFFSKNETIGGQGIPLNGGPQPCQATTDAGLLKALEAAMKRVSHFLVLLQIVEKGAKIDLLIYKRAFPSSQ
jgi:hypothetical protein